VGAKLARRLGLPFFDTDVLIAERAGRTIRQIVVDDGWEAFRFLERRVVAGLPRTNCVVALGGGAVLDPANVAILKEGGFFVWLTADTDTLLLRLAADAKTDSQRPPLNAGNRREELERSLRERLPIYRRVADRIVDTSALSIAEAADAIAAFTAGGHMEATQRRGG
jgi:shikimate kinase